MVFSKGFSIYYTLSVKYTIQFFLKSFIYPPKRITICLSKKEKKNHDFNSKKKLCGVWVTMVGKVRKPIIILFKNTIPSVRHCMNI